MYHYTSGPMEDAMGRLVLTGLVVGLVYWLYLQRRMGRFRKKQDEDSAPEDGGTRRQRVLLALCAGAAILLAALGLRALL